MPKLTANSNIGCAGDVVTPCQIVFQNRHIDFAVHTARNP
jgi:hypothetical protein